MSNNATLIMIRDINLVLESGDGKAMHQTTSVIGPLEAFSIPQNIPHIWWGWLCSNLTT
jgi:hypothetical protein